MKSLTTALRIEFLKVRKSKVFPISIYFFIFIGIMMGLLMYLSAHPELAGRSAAIQMKTSFLQGNDWKAFFSLMIQLILTIPVIGSGIITSWMFGRESAEGVLKDILVLPVGRSTIVVSKLIILFFWSLLLAISLLVASMLTGFATGLSGLSVSDLASFLKIYFVCAILNSLLITPVAFVASAGRGYMLSITFVILIMIFTQLIFIGMPGVSYWFPWAVPALFSGVAGESMPAAGIASYLIYIFTIIAGLLATIGWWKYADHK